MGSIPTLTHAVCLEFACSPGGRVDVSPGPLAFLEELFWPLHFLVMGRFVELSFVAGTLLKKKREAQWTLPGKKKIYNNNLSGTVSQPES